MNKLRLDLEALEAEHLDVSTTGLTSDLESLGMGHGATELSHSCDNEKDCQGEFCNQSGGCDGASCVDTGNTCNCNCNCE